MTELGSFFFGRGLREALANNDAHPLFEGLTDPADENDVIKTFLVHGFARYRVVTQTSGLSTCFYDLATDVRRTLVNRWDRSSLLEMLESQSTQLGNLVAHKTLLEHCSSDIQIGHHMAWLEELQATYANNLAARNDRVPLSIGIDFLALYKIKAASQNQQNPDSLLANSHELIQGTSAAEFVANAMASLNAYDLRWSGNYHDPRLWERVFRNGVAGLHSDDVASPLPDPTIMATMALRSGREFPSAVTVIVDELDALQRLKGGQLGSAFEGWLCIPYANALAGGMIIEDPLTQGSYTVFLYHRHHQVCFVVGHLEPQSKDHWFSQIDSYFSQDPFSNVTLSQGTDG